MHSYTHVCCNDFYTSWQHRRAMDVFSEINRYTLEDAKVELFYHLIKSV